MQHVRFGVFLRPEASGIAQLRRNVQTAEQSGFDYVSIQDHPYIEDFLDTLTLIANLAADTSRIQLMPNVANLALRPAPMLAKASATIDILSEGRFELGLGGGRLWEQIVGLGGPQWSPAETVAATTEAIETLRALWDSDGVVSLPGGHYPLVQAHAGPRPAHRIGIWLGVAGPRMLDLLGRKADGWIAPLSTNFETKPAGQNRIDAAARAAGRDPDDVRRVIQLVGTLTDTPTGATRPTSGPGVQPLRASPGEWARIITEFIDGQRFDTVNFVPEHETPDQVERFAATVIPAVRKNVTSATGEVCRAAP